MGRIGPGEILLLALLALLLFGATRIADIGKGLGEGIKNFKKGMQDDEAKADTPPPPAATVPPKTIENHPADSRATSEDKSKAV